MVRATRRLDRTPSPPASCAPAHLAPPRLPARAPLTALRLLPLPSGAHRDAVQGVAGRPRAGGARRDGAQGGGGGGGGEVAAVYEGDHLPRALQRLAERQNTEGGQRIELAGVLMDMAKPLGKDAATRPGPPPDDLVRPAYQRGAPCVYAQHRASRYGTSESRSRTRSGAGSEDVAVRHEVATRIRHLARHDSREPAERREHRHRVGVDPGLGAVLGAVAPVDAGARRTAGSPSSATAPRCTAIAPVSWSWRRPSRRTRPTSESSTWSAS